MKFYLGTHIQGWLWSKPNMNFFVSDRMLRKLQVLRPAISSWGLDSGGFTELSTTGQWNTTAQEYIVRTRRYVNEIGKLDFAAIQDWMCEPFIIAKTGHTIVYHQERTIDSYIDLVSRDITLPWIPILQGWSIHDYHNHIEMYAKRGIYLSNQPLVGVGSVCRRQHTDEIHEIFTSLKPIIPNMHGFGVKTRALKKYAHLLYSSDSMSWSLSGRFRPCHNPAHKHKNSNHCIDFAERYYRNIQGII